MKGTTTILTQGDNQIALNEEERILYDSLKQTSDVSILQNSDPITTAKFYVFSQYVSNYDVTYFLYTQREGYVAWTKEEDQQIAIEDRPTKEKLIKLFKNIQFGKFVEINDDEGYIEYASEQVEKSYFQMIKDENGIWKVESFMPIQ